MIIPVVLLIHCLGGKQKIENNKLRFSLECNEDGISTWREVYFDKENEFEHLNVERYLKSLVTCEVIHSLYEERLYYPDLEEVMKLCRSSQEESYMFNSILYYLFEDTPIKNIEELITSISYPLSWNLCYNTAILEQLNSKDTV